MDEEPRGRRERNRDRTRARIRAAALELFAERGFAAATVAQIAARAEVAERTFFRYFESKEDLLLPDLQGLFAAITAEVGRRLEELPPLAAAEGAVLAVMRVHPATGGIPVASADGAGLGGSSGMRVVRAFTAWEEQLFTVFLAHTGRAEDDREAVLWARNAAMVSVAATRAAWRTTGGVREGEEAFTAAIGQSFALVARGVPDWSPRRP